MRRAFFEYVDQIRAAEKYFDVSREEIRRLLMTKGKCHLPCDVDIVDSSGQPATAGVRLNISAVAESPLCWTMALKLHDIRIDGVDYESRFRLANGDVGHGWHRHQWNASDETADRHKVEVADFDTVTTRDEFIIRGLSLMRVRLSAVDHGQDLLFA